MKYIPYGRHHIDSDDIKEVTKVLRSDWITQGPKIEEFEKELANYCGAKYAVAVSSGTAALHIACLACGIERGDEVIISPLTFVASANCVLYCGGKPVFADIQEDTVNIDPEEIRKKVAKKTKAIIPVHYAGHPCDLKEIQEIAKRHKLIVIEDAAHALGAKYKVNGKWIKAGSCKHSDMTVFSFHPLKSITTGEGGCILTNSKNLYKNLKALRSHGVYKDKKTVRRGPWYYEMRELGLNYRITDFQCALGLSQLKKLDRFVNERRKIAYFYHNRLSNVEEIELPVERDGVKSSWHLYPIRLKAKSGYKYKRKKLFNYFRNNKIGVQVHYIPVYMQPYYQKLGYKRTRCPVAESYYERAISLPMYPGLSCNEMDFVVAKIKEGVR